MQCICRRFHKNLKKTKPVPNAAHWLNLSSLCFKLYLIKVRHQNKIQQSCIFFIASIQSSKANLTACLWMLRSLSLCHLISFLVFFDFKFPKKKFLYLWENLKFAKFKFFLQIGWLAWISEIFKIFKPNSVSIKAQHFFSLKSVYWPASRQFFFHVI